MIRHALCVALATSPLVVACGGDDAGSRSDTTGGSEVVVDGAPTVAFDAPTSDALVPLGEAVIISVRVTDNGPLSELRVTVTSDRSPTPLFSGPAPESGTLRLERADLASGRHVLTATVTDARDLSSTTTVTVTINTPPAAPTVSISPATPDTEAELVATLDAPATDPEHADLTYSYRWFKDGVATSVQTDRVSPALTARGEVWRVVVRASDGLSEGEPGEATVTIGNAAPSCGAVTFLPSSATTTQDLTCRCTDFQDPDGDAAVESCRFYIDGALVEREATGCTLDAELTTRGTSVTCELVPDDGASAGTPVTSTAVEIRNSKPVAATPTLGPTSGDTTTSFTCTSAASTDPDGDPVTTRVAWLVNGNVHATHGAASAVPLTMLASAGVAPKKGDSIACRVIANDGLEDSLPATSAPVVLANAAPVEGNVFVRAPGAAAKEGDTLTCELSGFSDPDGDTLAPTVTWTVSGEAVAGETGTTLGSQHFERGDTVACSVVASDGVAATAPVASKNTLSVINAPPSVATVTVGPGEVSRSGELSCVATGASDPDGDTVTLSYTWFVDGVPVAGATGATLSASTLAPGDVVTCAATPTDGTTAGTATASSGSATIVNGLPTLGGALLGPEGAKAGATLTCSPTGYSDPDGDAATYTYVWTNNGVPISGATGPTLEAGFEKGDHLRCRVSASDGAATTAEVVSNEVVIANTLPEIGLAEIEPGAGGVCETFTCVARDVVDADGDTTALSFAWEKNGNPTTETGPAFLGALSSGDVIVCKVRAGDGTLEGGSPVYGATATSEPAYVDNTPPSIASVKVEPADAGVGDTVTCAVSGYEDDCSDPAYAFAWTRNGAIIAGQTGATLETGTFDLGDDIACRATPLDDEGSGTAITATAIDLKKGDPVAPVVAVSSPEGASVGVTCEIVTAERWFESPTYTYYWTINGGAELSTTSATLPAGKANDCDVVTCRVVVTDATASLSSETATLQLPLFEGCEDGNDCTSHVCKPEGGCAVVIEDGTFCEDGDPCSPTGVCDQGTCVASGNLCYEEPVSLGTQVPTVRPALATRPDGSYAVQWTDGASAFLRFVAADDSRQDEILAKNIASGTNATNALAWDAEDRLAFPEWHGIMDSSSGYQQTSRTQMNMTVHVLNPDGTVVADDVLWTVIRDSVYGCSSTARVRDLQSRGFVLGGTVAMAATGWGQYDICPGLIVGNNDIVMVRAAGDYVGVVKSLVAGSERAQASIFDVQTTPPGSSKIVTAWLGSDGTTVKARLASVSGADVLAGTTVDVDARAGAVSMVRLAALSDGGFVVAWSRNMGANAIDTFYRRFDTSGAAVGGPVQVNAKVAGDQRLGGVAAFDDGAVVVVWDDPNDGGGKGVYGRIFDAADAPEREPFQLNNLHIAGDQQAPEVATFPGDGGFVAAWLDATSGTQLVTRRFFRDGDPDPGVRERPVPYATAADQTAPAGAATPDDRILVAYESSLYPGKETEIQARLFDRDGKPFDFDFTVNTRLDAAQRAPAVAASQDRFAVVWESVGQDGELSGIYLQRFDGRGQPLGVETRVNDTTAGSQTEPVIAARTDGSFIVAWTGKETAGASTDVFVKVYDRDGNVLLGETVANDFKTGSQTGPALTVTKTGAFIVAWDSLEQVSQGLHDVFMRKLTLSANNAPTWGPELQANTTVAGEQENASLSISQGTIAYLTVCWESIGAGTTDRDVVCQVFREQGAGFPVERAEFVPHTYKTGVQRRPKVLHGTDGKVVVAWETPAGVDFSGTAIQYLRLPAAGPAVQLPRYLATRWQYDDQTRPFLARMHRDLGRVLIGWQSKAQDGSGEGVYMRAPFPLD